MLILSQLFFLKYGLCVAIFSVEFVSIPLQCFSQYFQLLRNLPRIFAFKIIRTLSSIRSRSAECSAHSSDSFKPGKFLSWFHSMGWCRCFLDRIYFFAEVMLGLSNYIDFNPLNDENEGCSLVRFWQFTTMEDVPWHSVYQNLTFCWLWVYSTVNRFRFVLFPASSFDLMQRLMASLKFYQGKTGIFGVCRPLDQDFFCILVYQFGSEADLIIYF